MTNLILLLNLLRHFTFWTNSPTLWNWSNWNRDATTLSWSPNWNGSSERWGCWLSQNTPMSLGITPVGWKSVTKEIIANWAAIRVSRPNRSLSFSCWMIMARNMSLKISSSNNWLRITIFYFKMIMLKLSKSPNTKKVKISIIITKIKIIFK